MKRHPVHHLHHHTPLIIIIIDIIREKVHLHIKKYFLSTKCIYSVLFFINRQSTRENTLIINVIV